jgi:hypothetical protein
MRLIKNFLAVLLTLLSLSAYGQNLARYNWTRLPISVGADAYIDLTKLEGDKVFGFKVVTLLSFDQISSAQMWGLSDVSELSVNCSKGTFQYLKTTWTEKQMAAGKIEKVFNAPQKTPTRITDILDGTYERRLFRYLCA